MTRVKLLPVELGMLISKDRFCLTFVTCLLMFTRVFASMFSSYYDITSSCDITYGIVIETATNIRSITECGWQCDRIRECMSVKYDRVNLRCHLNSYRLPYAVNNTCTAKFKYAELNQTSNKKLINDECSIPNDYPESNIECAMNKWQCKPGYSYKRANESCVTSCDSYGSTFTRHPGRYIDEANGRSPHEITAEGCLQACVNETEFECRTVDFYSYAYCYITTDTAMTAPGSYKSDITSDHYQRNCQ